MLRYPYRLIVEKGNLKTRFCQLTVAWKKHETTQERSHSCAQSVTSVFQDQVLEGALEDPHRREALLMLEIWHSFSKSDHLRNSWALEGTWEDPQRREAIQVHKVWQELLTIKVLDNTWDHTDERIHSSAQRVRCFQDQVLSRSMRGPIQERSHSDVLSVTRASRNQTTYRILRGPTQ